MNGHPQAQEKIGDEAVEHPAEKVLIAERQLGPEAEERVRRNAAFRKDGRNERQPIRGARHIPVGQPWPQVAPIP